MNYKDTCDKDGCHSADLEALDSDEAKILLGELEGDWETAGWSDRQRRGCLFRTFSFENFADGLKFVNNVGAIAEKMNHHPKIELEWGKVYVELCTHAVNNLTELDFSLAKKIDKVK